jgi:hypothetical protein
MSVDASLTLQLVCPDGLVAVIKAVLSSKWTSHGSNWWCVPLDEDTSDWEEVEDTEAMISLFEKKIAVGQTFGVRLWWEGGESGGELLVTPDGTVVFSPTIHRVTLNGRASDASWYLARLLPLFQRETGAILEGWEWNETA